MVLVEHAVKWMLIWKVVRKLRQGKNLHTWNIKLWFCLCNNMPLAFMEGQYKKEP